MAEYGGPIDEPYPVPRCVAVKLLKYSAMHVEGDVLSLVEEARVLHQLRHE
jgi:hypothetical protein